METSYQIDVETLSPLFRNYYLGNSDFFGALRKSGVPEHLFPRNYVDWLGADLRGARLYRARIDEAWFDRANLEDANLSCSTLRGASFCCAFLKNSSLRYANLRGAKLVGAYLSNTDFTGADLRGADLCFAYLVANDSLANAIIDNTTQFEHVSFSRLTLLPKGRLFPPSATLINIPEALETLNREAENA